MKEVLISSSVLILALTALRFLFRERISRRLQYVLWGLVLLRLALPVPLPEARFSVMTGAERLSGRIDTVRPVPSVSNGPAVSPAPSPVSAAPYVEASSGGATAVTRSGFSMAELFLFVWLAGLGLTLGCFLLSNLRFSLQLRRSRTRFDAPGCPLPVYVSAAVLSPCLFGLFRPAVYLTPKAASEPETQLRHVLTHELCHYRHGDHVWSVLRCLVVSFYWFDPLVWLAAALSRIDGEQACDEAAIRALGEEQRLSYGKTLVDMIAVRNAPSALFCSATTMVSGKKSLKIRLERIARRRKPLIWAAALALLAAAALAGCTFTAAKKNTEPPNGSERYIEYTDIPDEELEASETLDSRYDLFRFHHSVENSPGLNVWAERWEYGVLTDWSQLAKFNLSGEPEDLDIGFYELKKEGADFRDLDFLVSRRGETLYSSVYVPAGGEFAARATTWLGSGSDNRYDVTVKEPVILLGLAYHNADNGDLHSYDCEYLMENPDALNRYELIVLIKCAFAGEDGKYAPLPTLPALDQASDVQDGYAVTLIKDGAETPVTGFDPSLPRDVIFDGLVKSAAWPAEGISDRPYAFRIKQILTTKEGSELHDYYAYRLDDGAAAILTGSYYSILDEKLMVQLEEAAGIEPGQIYNLDAAITKAILKHANGMGELQTEAHETLAITCEDRSDGAQIIAYVMALDLSFDSDGETLSETGGGLLPVAVSFDQNLDGAYTLTEYWTPREGAYYAPSIRGKFPSDIAEDAIDSQKYAMPLNQSCYARAIAWFGLDLTEEIAGRVETLCNTPGWETPSPYVEPGYLDFRQLLFYGDETLRYVFGEFLKGGQTGERGYVLQRLMGELLGAENPDVPANDGQAYFDQWKERVLKLYHEHGLDYVKERAPKGYLLLDVMDVTRPWAMDAPAFG